MLRIEINGFVGEVAVAMARNAKKEEQVALQFNQVQSTVGIANLEPHPCGCSTMTNDFRWLLIKKKAEFWNTAKRSLV